MRTVKLLVLETKIKKTSKDEHEQLKYLLKKYSNIDLQITYEKIERDELFKIKVVDGSIVQSDIRFDGNYNWVHVRISSYEWKKLKLRSNLYGEHQKVNGVSVTFGRWSQFVKYKRAHLFKDEFPEVKKLYEHVVGMIHELGHGNEGNIAMVHSFMYGYKMLYTKLQEKHLRPKRYEKDPSLLKVLDWIYTKSSISKTIETVKAQVIPKPKPRLYKPKNFDIKELVSKITFNKYGERAWQFYDQRILECLQYVRDFYGVPVTVNDWYKGGRFQYRGFDEGGFRKHGYSQHNHGRAIDFIVMGISSNQVRNDLRSGKLKPPYPIWVEDKVGWNHWDVRASDKMETVYFFQP